jgi:hypothetical protein
MAESEAPLPLEEAPAPAAKPLVKKLKVAGIVAGIVFVQCFVAYLYLPSAESTASASSKTDLPPEPAKHLPAERDQTEVDLGSFSLTVFNPNSNNNLLVDFHLFGTVLGSANPQPTEKKDGVEDDDAAKLEKMLKGHKNRFRDQVITTIRNAQITDLADPGLGLLKRQILAKTNALLGEPLVKEIIFSDFVIVEQ